MKKFYVILALALFFLAHYGFSQTVVTQTFQTGGSIPTGWTVTNSGGTNWSEVNTNPYPPYPAAYTGTYWMDFPSWAVSSGNYGLLITPVIDWSGRGGVATTVTAYIWRDASYCAGVGDNTTVYVNTSASVSGATNLGVVPRWAGSAISGGVTGTSAPGTNGWYLYTFTIPTTFNSNTNYIIFQANSSYGADVNMATVQYTTYPCTAPTGGTITGNSPVCRTSTLTLADATGTVGGTWSSSNTAVATVSSSGVVTGVTAGTANISYTASACSTSASATVVVTVNAIPAAITGVPTVCNGSTTTLSNSVSGGTWTSSATSVGTVVSTTGVVTAVSPGTTTIYYTLPDGCPATNLVVTVNPQPSAIGGTAVVCQGQTTTLTDPSSGGTWTSANTTLATAGSSTGVVTGVGGGLVNISYTLSGGCYVVKPVTVNADAPITGGSSVCIGYTMSLSNTTAGGGTWSSANTSVATINSATGLLSSVALGGATISYTATATGCVTTSSVNVTNPPSAYTVTGGGSYCSGGSGVVIGLSGSDAGVTYSLFHGVTLVTTVLGTGSPVSFPPQTVSGAYNVIANYGTPCMNTMLGTATISINPLPTAYYVTGGGSYCVGGTGVVVGLSSSTVGVNYQLYWSGTAVGSAVLGTGAAISFGLQTATGTYTVVATNATTLCSNTMTGSAVVGTNALPTTYNMTGGGGYCSGGAGSLVGLSGSDLGVNYQLYVGGVATGSALPGTGGPLSFGTQTTVGAYTVVATNATTGCVAGMVGTSIVSTNPLPTAFLVTEAGTGSYCLGGIGVLLGVNGSQVGVNYQLYLGSSPVGAPVAGTGVAISFGYLTTAGTYTVSAINTVTGCTNVMTGSAVITISPLPTVYSMTGGGGYCAGGTGANVGLSGSTIGVNYQLYNGTMLVGAISGTGGALAFGLETAAGTYTVVATNATTGCVANMSGSSLVSINPLPTIFSVTGGGLFCTGGAGVTVGLSNSTAGVSYQLYNGVALVGSPVSGTAAALSFGLQTGTGSYSVSAVNATTGCASNMSGSATVGTNPLPSVYAVTGGGSYCSGTSGVAIGLASSNAGISYQLYNTSGAVGSPVSGTGSALNFGLQTFPTTRDSVIATNTATGCSSLMSGNVPVAISAAPSTFAVTGGGGYCAGSTGVNVNLGGSVTGINYQLFNGSAPVGAAIAGTGMPIVFGPETGAGSYTVVASNAVTACTSNMGGSVAVFINTLPGSFSVSGGGAYCSGGTGVNVGLAGSVTGINYQLYYAGSPLSSLVPGTGLPINFGAQTLPGAYTVVAITPGTFCQSNMSGSASVVVNPLPAHFNVTGGGSYCAGGAGVSVGLSGSAIGINYQLFNSGIPVGGLVAGLGSVLPFGSETAGGSYTVVATDAVTGCNTPMSGSASVVVNPLPAAFTVIEIGSGSYCPGGSGIVVGVNGSSAGVSYQLYNGAVAAGSPGSGTGFPVSFGAQTAPGSYSVVATNTVTGCTNNMTGTASVSLYPLPTVYSVTGGGSYCAGGAGVSVGLGNSATGIQYQLFNGSAPVGAPIVGSGAAISFGLQTSAGSYTVVATNRLTTCSRNMASSATVAVSPLPTVHNVTGGGNYCTGGAGLHIGLNGSDTGITYQSMFSGSPVGATVHGSGAILDLGVQSVPGSYNVTAINTATGCTNMMAGSVSIGTLSLPNPYNVAGGGSFCAGGTGVPVSLEFSDAGVSYQLKMGGTVVGLATGGTGSAISFGNQTGAGVYSVVATDLTTGCTNNMSGTATVAVTPLPSAFIVAGGGNYCAGSAGVPVTLSSSESGVTYQLFINSIPSTVSMAGTGGALNFGMQTAGGNYTVVATNSILGCNAPMLGSAIVNINPLPNAYMASSTSTNFCSGSTGVGINLSGSDLGTNYQLYFGTVAVGVPLIGTGSPLSFGMVSSAGTYSIVATNTVTGCSAVMTPNVPLFANPLPASFGVTGGGAYCNGGAGVAVGMANSNAGVTYQLMLSGTGAVGLPVNGTGGPISFGLQTVSGTYIVVATTSATGCTNNMAGSATVVVNTLPTAYTVTGGGNYCAGSAGSLIGLSGSATGVHYQLELAGVATGAPVAGTPGPISFGAQTGAGTYTAVATNSTTGCSSNMTGSVHVGINAAPTSYTVTGGGNYCPGATGVPVGLAGSATGFTYQLYLGATAIGAPLSASAGGAISFGLQTASGAYTVTAIDSVTGCTASMAGSAVVGLNTLPAVFNVIGGGNYCAGGSGVHIGLSNSVSGISYVLSGGSVTAPTHVTVAGSGSPLDFGLIANTGVYTVQATNSVTGCVAEMSGTGVVGVNSLVSPSVAINSSNGDTICGGDNPVFSVTTSNSGSTPSFQWSVNGVVSGTGSTYSYTPANGDVLGVSMLSSANCATPATVSNTLALNVMPKEMPAVSVTVTPGNEICQGGQITLTANPSYGGTAPLFTWMKNSVFVSSGVSYAYTPANGDDVYCILTSNYHCRLSNSVNSTHTNVTVDVPTLPVVTISATPGNSIAAGQDVVFTATVANGGPTPQYQWLVDGAAVPGANGTTFSSSTLANNDSVTCQVLSSGGCPGLLGFNSVTMHVANVGVVSVQPGSAAITLAPNPNSGNFVLTGSLGSQFAGNETLGMNVVNMLGQVVLHQDVTAHNGAVNEQVTLPANQPKGNYILELHTPGGNLVFHFVVE